ncbi:hypothetical protein LINPERPRIM_LOCUS2481 [Linum perenne]
MNFWVPLETIPKQETTSTKPPTKPVVVLIHGFAGEGIVTWQFQVGALTKKYSVYVPDLLFFGGSVSDSSDRSPRFQAETLVKGLRKLGVEVMFSNRKERGELLEGLVISNQDTTIPKFRQRIHLLWGENDQIFRLDLAQNMKEQLGEKATVESISKAGHLVHLERPCAYNKCLQNILATLHSEDHTTNNNNNTPTSN